MGLVKTVDYSNMHRTLLIFLILIISANPVKSNNSSHLEIIKKDSIIIYDSQYYNYMGTMSVLLLGEDTTLFGCGAGIFAKYDQKESWTRLLGSSGIENPPPNDNCLEKKKRRDIYECINIWNVVINGENEILIADDYCGWLYSLHITDNDNSYVISWGKRNVDEYLRMINIQNDKIAACWDQCDSNKSIIIMNNDGLAQKTIFIWPKELKHHLDSIGFTCGDYHLFPVINPCDSTIWIAANGYNYIFIVTMDGNLKDSLIISAPDYHMPPKLKSRIKSQAVWREWSSHWTPIYDFVYAPPGYFILVYHISDELPAVKQVWDTYGQEVNINIDPGWHILGVQPDGRIIFGYYEEECDVKKHKYTFYITRIIP